jgi:hypothetical protein
MVRARRIDWLARGSVVLFWLGIAGPESRAGSAPTDAQASHRTFAASKFAIDEILARPFDRDVPMGCTGARLWASSPRGWAFGDDVHWLDLAGFDGFELEVSDERGLLEPAEATYYPSHIHYGGARRKWITASASFTFALDNVNNPLEQPFEPRKRWTCWSSGTRHDWYAIDLGIPRTVSGFDLFFFDDAPTAEIGRGLHSRRAAYFLHSPSRERIVYGSSRLSQAGSGLCFTTPAIASTRAFMGSSRSSRIFQQLPERLSPLTSLATNSSRQPIRSCRLCAHTILLIRHKRSTSTR